MTSLRQRMIDDLRVRNYAPGTISLYTRSVASFAKHFGKSPDQLGPEHIREYQTFLVNTKKASWPVFNQAVCALRFFYKFTLGKPWVSPVFRRLDDARGRPWHYRRRHVRLRVSAGRRLFLERCSARPGVVVVELVWRNVRRRNHCILLRSQAGL